MDKVALRTSPLRLGFSLSGVQKLTDAIGFHVGKLLYISQVNQLVYGINEIIEKLAHLQYTSFEIQRAFHEKEHFFESIFGEFGLKGVNIVEGECINVSVVIDGLRSGLYSFDNAHRCLYRLYSELNYVYLRYGEYAEQ